MEQFGLSDYGLTPTTHEYPDPDYAAYTTKYPWREDDGYLPSALEDLSSKSLGNPSRSGSEGGAGKADEQDGGILQSHIQEPAREAMWDPDYQASVASVT